MPTSILKSASSSKKKKMRVRLELEKFDVQEISPTNRLLKSELFYNASDFANFQFDAEYGSVVERQRRDTAAREKCERENELRRRQDVLWGDQQLRNSDTLRAVLSCAAAAFSASPPSHKRARDSSDKPLPCAQHALAPASEPPALPATDSMADRDVLERACRRQRCNTAPEETTTVSLFAPAARDVNGTLDADVSAETTVPGPTTDRTTGAGSLFAPSAYRAAMARRMARVSSATASQPSTEMAATTWAAAATARVPMPEMDAEPAAERPDGSQPASLIASCGGALMRTDALQFGVGVQGMPGSVSFAPRPARGAAVPLVDRSNRDDGPRSDRLKSEIDGLTMAQLKEKIQDVTRRRRARHKEAMAALITPY